MKGLIAAQESSHTTKPHNFTNVEDVITVTNSQLGATMLYIADNVFIPKKNEICRCYRSNEDFVLKTREEAKKLIKDKKVMDNHRDETSDFFVYNERKEELLPFKKNDYLMYEHGYFTFDGTTYFSYDDNGHEI